MDQPIDVFISHHTSTCLQVTQAICHSLESSGLRCWYAPRDTDRAYASSIVSAINRCSVFVLVLNYQSSVSQDVLNEINLAVERLRRGENLAILPFQISADMIGDDAKYYLGRIHWIDAVTPPMEQRIEELKMRILTLLERTPTPQVSAPVSHSVVKLKSSNLLPNANFVGRQAELQQIGQLMDSYNKLFLQGMGGIGKSELAKAYALKNRVRYNTILFATYHTSLQDLLIHDPAFQTDDIPRACDAAGRLESDEVYFARKLRWLQENADEKTLLIIDNFDTDGDPDLESFLNGQYAVLFTTRNDFAEWGLPVLPLTELDAETEQMELFAHYYRRPVPVSQQSIVRQVLSQVGGHTLAIEIIAKFMGHRRVQPDKMLSILQQEGVQAMTAGTVTHGFGKAQSGYANIRQLFHLHGLTQQELYVLRNLALVPLTGLDTVIFGELCELDDYTDIDELIRRSWIRHDPMLDTISLHPLIRDVVLKECNVTLDACSVMVRNLTDRLLQLWAMPQEDKLRYGNLGKAVYERFPQFDLTYSETYRAIAMGVLRLEQHELCHIICMQCLTGLQAAQGDHALEIAEVYYRLSDNELHRNNPEGAVAYLTKTIEIMQKAAPNTERLAYMIKFLAWIRIGWFTEHDETERLLQQSHQILLAQEPQNELQLASQNSAYANVYYLMGQYEKALPYAEKSYAVYAARNGELHGDTLAPMIIKAKILSKTGQAEESVALCQRVIDLQKQLNGEEHQLVLNRYEALADIYASIGQREKAILTFQDLCCRLDKRKDTTSPFRQRINKKLANFT